MRPTVYYFDAKFSKWWRTKEEAKMNSIEPVAVVNLSDYEKLQKQLAVAVDALEEGWQLAQHYGEFESIEKVEEALKQIEELSK